MRNEADLRKWVINQVGKDRLFRVENKSGGQFGFFDLLLPYAGLLLPAELKWDKVRPRKEGGGWWKVKLRPSQMNVARRFVDTRTRAVVVVGNEEGVWVGSAASCTLAPEVHVVKATSILSLIVEGIRLDTMVLRGISED